MRWKTETPKIGDIRKLVKFAWLPTKLDDGHTVWLEQYSVTECYEDRLVITKFFISHVRTDWHPVRRDLYVPTYSKSYK